MQSADVHQETGEKPLVKKMKDIYMRNKTEKESQNLFGIVEEEINSERNREGNDDNPNGNRTTKLMEILMERESKSWDVAVRNTE